MVRKAETLQDGVQLQDVGREHMRLGLKFAGILIGLLATAVATAHEPGPPPHSVSVNGSGEASAKPDRARLLLAVEQLNPDLKKAQDEVDRIVRAYLKDAKALGAKDEDLTTTGVSIAPEYVWPEPGHERRFTGYRVNRQLEIRILNLERLGDFVLRATADGVTQVNPPSLESSRFADLQKQALARAAEDARAKARVLAETLGAKLGSVQHIAEAGGEQGRRPMVYMARPSAPESGNAEMGISTGEIRVEASISVDFDLLGP